MIGRPLATRSAARVAECLTEGILVVLVTSKWSAPAGKQELGARGPARTGPCSSTVHCA